MPSTARRGAGTRDLGRYLDALGSSSGAGSQPRIPPGGSDPLDPAGVAAETAFLALRTDRGLPLAAAAEPPLAAVYPWALDAGLLTVDPADRIVLTTRGRLLSNELFRRLI